MVITVLTVLVCTGIGFLPAALAAHDLLHIVLLRVMPLTLVAWAACFAIRGYSITPEEIVIHRLLWDTRLSRAGLQAAEYRPGAMKGSIRTFGNGGLFSFSGYYRNGLLGPYRAYVTEWSKTVILRYPTRTVMVSPSEPEAFAEMLAGDSREGGK